MDTAAAAVCATPSRKNVSHASQSALRPHRIEHLVVALAVLLEVETQIEQGFVQHLVVVEQQGDQQPSDAGRCPSRKGWMVSNWRCASPARSKADIPGTDACKKRSRSDMQSATSCGGGGTKVALPGRVPPIQFCDRRKFPGSCSLPRPPAMSRRCTSRSSRFDSGNPASSRSRPCSSAAT